MEETYFYKTILPENTHEGDVILSHTRAGVIETKVKEITQEYALCESERIPGEHLIRSTYYWGAQAMVRSKTREPNYIQEKTLV